MDPRIHPYFGDESWDPSKIIRSAPRQGRQPVDVQQPIGHLTDMTIGSSGTFARTLRPPCRGTGKAGFGSARFTPVTAGMFAMGMLICTFWGTVLAAVRAGSGGARRRRGQTAAGARRQQGPGG